MYQMIRIICTTIYCFIFTFSGHAVAEACYEQSPYFTLSEDDYYNLEDTIKLSNKEKNQLTSFLTSIKGNWKGKSEYIECRGPDRAPKKLLKNATVKVKIKPTSATKLSIFAEKNLQEKRVKRSDNFTFPNIENTYALAFSDTNTLTFSERYRRSNTLNTIPKEPEASSNTVTIVDKTKNPNSTPVPSKPTIPLSSRLVERIYTVKRNANRLTIFRSFYANGVYVAKETWTMQVE